MKLANLKNKKKHRGFTLIELLIVLVVISVLTTVGLSIKPKVMEYLANIQISYAVDSIISIAPSYVLNNDPSIHSSIATMCADHALSERICGESKNGIGANPFGGDYKVGKSTEFPGHITVTVTDIKARSSIIINNLLARSLNQCTSIDHCNSAQITKTTGRNGGVSTSIEIDI